MHQKHGTSIYTYLQTSLLMSWVTNNTCLVNCITYFNVYVLPQTYHSHEPV